MEFNSYIGKWTRYPDKRQSFEASIFVYFHNENTLDFIVNVNPNFPSSNAYAITISFSEFKDFILGLYNGKLLSCVNKSGFFSRKFQVKGKYAFSEVSYIWKLPVSYTMFTITPQAVNNLYQDFCQM